MNVIFIINSAIFFLPSSPSFCISSKAGIAIVRSCIMIEDVMYGVIFKANTDMLRNDPPVIASKNPKPAAWLSNQLLNTSPLTPGTGS